MNPRKLEFIPHNCSICNQPLQRRHKENAYNFNKRKTCDPSTGRNCREEMGRITGRQNKGTVNGTMPPLKSCEICGAVIPYEQDSKSRYARRQLCRITTNPDCFAARGGQNGKKSAGIKKDGIKLPSVCQAKKAAPKKQRYSEKQRAELDRQQVELDRMVMMKGIEQFTSLPAVSLPREEIKRLESIYQPPTGRRQEILPHFRLKVTI